MRHRLPDEISLFVCPSLPPGGPGETSTPCLYVAITPEKVTSDIGAALFGQFLSGQVVARECFSPLPTSTTSEAIEPVKQEAAQESLKSRILQHIHTFFSGGADSFRKG